MNLSVFDNYDSQDAGWYSADDNFRYGSSRDDELREGIHGGWWSSAIPINSKNASLERCICVERSTRVK